MPKSLKKIALVVTLGTFSSKVFGLTRQIVIAGVFGVGAVYDAYNYAYILPGFFLILLGGINGPFHNAMVSVLSRKNKEESAYLFNAIQTFTAAFLILISLILFFNSESIIKLVGPGLNPETLRIAIFQLQIMSPIIILSGIIGITFGALNSKEEFLIPSISPILSSLSIIIFVSIFWIEEGKVIEDLSLSLKGGAVLAISTLIGALFQFVIQIPSLFKKGFIKFKIIWDTNNPGIKELIGIIIPATLSAGMLQINVFIDLFFASGIFGAASALSYANFLVQAPLGLLSNAIIIPLLPTLSKLKGDGNKKNLISRIRQGLILTNSSMIIVGTIFIVLGNEIVEIIYARGAFDSQAIKIVSALLIAYGIGMPSYLSRDLLVRVFYAIGNSNIPFKISTLAIGLNIIFDWVLIGGPTPWGDQIPFNLGVFGIVLATAFVNIASCIALLLKLKSFIKPIKFMDWAIDNLKLFSAGLLSGLITWTAKIIIVWPNNMTGLLIKIIFCSSISLFLFLLISNYLNIKEAKELIKIIKKKIINF